MAIDTEALVYPFDPTGRQASNAVTAEQQILTARNGQDFQFLVPRYAPYFPDTMQITFRDTNNVVKVWTRGQDWFPTHEFIAASLATAKEVYGSLSVQKTNLSGVVSMTYQTLGGDWVQDTATISEILSNRLYNPRIAVWDEVANIPYAFPVIDHEWNLDDLVGMAEVRDEIAAIGEQLRQSGQAGLAEHIADHDNPHQVTAEQVGLGLVRNLPTATAAEMVSGTSDDLYATAKGVRSAMDAGPTAAITSHAGNTGNPHNTTAAQVGAYSKTEMDTALAQKLGRTATAANTDKFGGLTPLEYAADVLQGTAANSMRLGGLTVDDLKLEIQGGPAVDTERFNGLTYPEAKADILSGDATNALAFGGRDPVQYRDYVLAGTAANAAEVGGYTPDELRTFILGGDAANALKFGGRTPAEFTSDVLSGTAANSVKLANLTVTQLTSQILAGTAANANKAFGFTLSELATSILAGTAANTLKFDGLTAEQYKTNVLAGTAANADQFGGMTPQEWQNSLLTGSGSVFAKQNKWTIAKGDGNALTWLRMGALQFKYTSGGAHPNMAIQWLVSITSSYATTDADYATDQTTETGIYLVQASCEDVASEAVSLRVQPLLQTDAVPDTLFGYIVGDVTDPDTNAITRGAHLWVKSTTAQVQVTATDISYGTGFIDMGIPETSEVTDAGMQYGTVSMLPMSAETFMFDSMTAQNWYSYIYNEDYTNSIPQRNRGVVLDYNTTKTGWVLLGTVNPNDWLEFKSSQFLVSTAVSQQLATAQPTGSLNLVRFDLARSDFANMVATHRVFGAPDTNIQFGYTTSGGVVQLWMKVTGRLASVSVSLLSKANGDVPAQLDVPVMVEPAGITYMSTIQEATKADLNNYATTTALATTNGNVTTVNNNLNALAIDIGTNYALKTYVDALRTDVESALTALKDAIDTLTTQINS